MADACPCQSGAPYEACCGPFHAGGLSPTAERLMRSRYCAFALGKGDYLCRTSTMQSNAEELSAWSKSVTWLGLTVHARDGDERQAFVEFTARYLEGASLVCLRERSRFTCALGNWTYVGGDPVTQVHQVERNERCPCASGKKFKACHGRDG